MQGNIIKMLEAEGFKLEKIELRGGEGKPEEIYEIRDPERLIFFVYLQEAQQADLEDYVNEIMNWISYEQSAREADMVNSFGKVTMRKILWDIYAVFACNTSECGERFSDEEIYSRQRNTHFCKRYIVQGDSDDVIAEKVKMIVRP